MNKNTFYSERQAKNSVSYTHRTEPTQKKLTGVFEQMPKISEVKGVQIYKRIQKPNLNIQKLNRIAKKLDLEKEAKNNFNARKNINELVIKYEVNRFSQLFESEIRPMQQTDILQKRIYEGDAQQQFQFQEDQNSSRQDSNFRLIDLIEGVESFKNRKVNEVNMARDMDLSIIQRSKDRQIFVNAAKQATLKLPLHHKISYYTHQVQTKVAKVKKQSDKDTEHFKNVMQLSDIINLKQKSYYKNQNIDNIFYLVFHKDKNIITGNQIFEKYHFCGDSMKEIAKNFKIPIYRDMSRLSRNLMRNIYTKQSKFQHLLVNEFNVAMDNITIESIFSVAAGRSTSDDINQQMKEQNLKSAKQDQINVSATEKKIWHKYNTISNGAQIYHNLDQVYKSKQIHLIPYTKQQVKCNDEMQKILKHLNTIQNFKQQIKSQNINDKQTMEQIQKEEKKILQKMFLYEGNLQKGNIDRTIRRNKKLKDRREEDIIKSITTAVMTKKMYDNKLNKPYGIQKLTHEIATNA